MSNLNGMDGARGVSVIIPFYNEEESVISVLLELQSAQPDAEIIAVDDGSSDTTWRLIQAFPGIVALRLSQNCGQSAALYAGLKAAEGAVLVTMDGDGQNDPADIPRLLSIIEEGGADVVCGRRALRRDAWHRRAASSVARWARRACLGDSIADSGCGIKAFRREAVEALVPFDGMHRFLPCLFQKAGFAVVEVTVNHRPRACGVSKYTNWERALRGIYDLVGVAWLLRRKIVLPGVARARSNITVGNL